MKIVVLGGAGHIGSRIVDEILRLNPSVELTIVDIDEGKGKQIAREKGVDFVKANVAVFEELLEVLKGKEVVVNSVGPFYRFGAVVLKTALNAGVNYVDINDDYDSTLEALALDKMAKEKGSTAVIGMGATPGVTNVLASIGAEKMEEIEEIGTYWVWTAMDPTMGRAIIEHFFHAITGNVKVFKDGNWIDEKALSEAEAFEFPEPIGTWEVAIVGHPEPITIPRYIKARKVFNKGGVWPSELNEIAKVFAQLGLTSEKTLNLRGEQFKAIEIAVEVTMSLGQLISAEELQSTLARVYERLGDYTLMGMGLGVRIKGKKDDKSYAIKYGIAFKDAAQATALPCAVCALELLDKELPNGVFPPEAKVIDLGRVISEVKKISKIDCTEIKNYSL
ncbi:MAG: saccharopine dehydrogenase family protein [Archaeoglobaceae archaeon]